MVIEAATLINRDAIIILMVDSRGASCYLHSAGQLNAPQRARVCIQSQAESVGNTGYKLTKDTSRQELN